MGFLQGLGQSAANIAGAGLSAAELGIRTGLASANLGTLLSTGAQIGTGIAGIVQAEQARGAAQRQFQQQQDLVKKQQEEAKRQKDLTEAQRAALTKKQEQQRRAAGFQGRAGTILTSPSGLISGGSQGKTLLGL